MLVHKGVNLCSSACAQCLKSMYQSVCNNLNLFSRPRAQFIATSRAKLFKHICQLLCKLFKAILQYSCVMVKIYLPVLANNDINLSASPCIHWSKSATGKLSISGFAQCAKMLVPDNINNKSICQSMCTMVLIYFPITVYTNLNQSPSSCAQLLYQSVVHSLNLCVSSHVWWFKSIYQAMYTDLDTPGFHH